jgi:hypothetical protein
MRLGLALTAMVVSSARAAGRSAFEAAPFAVIPMVAAALAARFFRALELGGNVHVGPRGGLHLAATARIARHRLR